MSATFLLMGSGLALVSAVPGASAATNTITVTTPSAEQSTVGTAVSVTVTATDSDTGAALTYSASGLPAGLSINSSTGTITGTPTGLAKDAVTVTATDSAGATGTSSIDWQVGGKITVTGTTEVGPGQPGMPWAGETVEDPLTVTDNANTDYVTGTATGLPPGLSYDPGYQVITGWPTTAVATGLSKVTATGLDGGNGSVNLAWSVYAPHLGATGPVRLNLGGKCLDDNGNKSTAGNKVDVWTCNGSAAQNWTYASNGSLQIHGMCLDTIGQSTAVNAELDLAACDQSSTGQEWDNDTGAQLRELNSGDCLTDPGSSTANGTQLTITACGTGSLRQWTLPAETIHSALSGHCLDDYQGNTANGATVDDYVCNGRATQNWTVKPDGTIRLAGKCLDDYRNRPIGGGIDLWTCNGSAAQQWALTGTSESLGLELQHGTECAGPVYYSPDTGTGIDLDHCNASFRYWHSW